MFENIILHVPHSSADFSFIGYRQDSSVAKKWRDAARDLIDWYTDELFVPEYPSANIHPVVFRTCRTVCDVERMSHDPLEDKGCGITCSRLLHFTKGYYVSADRRIHQLYLDHQYSLASMIIRYGDPFLIDCHSFSSRPTILQPDASKNADVDICIGFNDDFTRPSDDVIRLVCDYFKNFGYKVSLNSPFSGSKTVDIPAKYSSLMIEVNKGLYMDEDTLEKKMPEFLLLKGRLEQLYCRLAF